jgi:hypothetical protein
LREKERQRREKLSEGPLLQIPKTIEDGNEIPVNNFTAIILITALPWIHIY